MQVQPYLRGPWPLVGDLVEQELTSLLGAARDRRSWGAPTRCSPWTVRDLIVHVGRTFERYQRMLEQSRAGDLTAPFSPDALHEHNQQQIDVFDREPLPVLEEAVLGFVEMVDDPDEVMAHQRSPIPVGLQLRFGLNELALHHDDLVSAEEHRYTPPRPVIDALVSVWDRVLGPLRPGPDDWDRILVASGRPPVGQ